MYSQPHAAAEIKAGERAPFDGVLLKREDLATIVTNFEAQVARLKAGMESLQREHELNQEHSAAKCEIRVRAEKSETEACQAARLKETSIYEAAIKKASSTSFWTSPTFMAVLGIGAGAAVCAAAR